MAEAHQSKALSCDDMNDENDCCSITIDKRCICLNYIVYEGIDSQAIMQLHENGWTMASSVLPQAD